MNKIFFLVLLVTLPGYASAASSMASDRISDIRNTKHNFASDDLVVLPGGTSGTDGRNVKAVSENQVCVNKKVPVELPGL